MSHKRHSLKRNEAESYCIKQTPNASLPIIAHSVHQSHCAKNNTNKPSLKHEEKITTLNSFFWISYHQTEHSTFRKMPHGSSYLGLCASQTSISLITLWSGIQDFIIRRTRCFLSQPRAARVLFLVRQSFYLNLAHQYLYHTSNAH